MARPVQVLATMANHRARAVIDAPSSAWESDVRRTPERNDPSPLFELPRPPSVCAFPDAPVRDALPTLVEDPWFEEVADAEIEVVEEAPASFVHSVRGWLGRYELLSPVGAGGTWLARQHGERGFTKLAMVIAMPARFDEAQSCAELLADDARAAAALRHPNVCEVLELGEHGSTVFLASEWVTGVSLDALLRPQDGVAIPLPYAFAAHVVAEACAGLHAAHELRGEEGRVLGVVHRSVSLRTVLLTATGNVKVAELGTARAWARHEELETAERTRAYPSSVRLASIAPEVVAGGNFDRRSDVFSLGAVLYEATTGVAPFASVNDYESMDALLRGEYAKPSALVPGFPAALEAIIARALERDPVRRFATADAMRTALEAWLTTVGARVTTENVADFVNHRAGPALAAKREFLRELTAGPHGSGIRVTAHATSSGTVLRRPEATKSEKSDPSITLMKQARRRQRLLRWALALCVAAAFGGVSYASATLMDATTENEPVPAASANAPTAEEVMAQITAAAPKAAAPAAQASTADAVTPEPAASTTTTTTTTSAVPPKAANAASPAPAATTKPLATGPMSLPNSPY